MLVVKGQRGKRKTEETGFITYLIHFVMNLNIMLKYKFGKQGTVGYLLCVHIAVSERWRSKNDKIFELLVLIKT